MSTQQVVRILQRLQRWKKKIIKYSNQSCIYRSPGTGSSSPAPPRAAGVGSGDGRAGGGAGPGAAPAARRKPGLRAGGGGGGRGPSPSPVRGTDLPVTGRWDRQTSPAGQGGAVLPRVGQEMKAPLQGTHRAICCCCWVGFVLFYFIFNLLANSASVSAHSFPPLASLPGGSVPGARCAFQVTRQSTFCDKTCTLCCLSVHLVELLGILRWAKSFKISAKYSRERKTQQAHSRV